MLVPRRGRGHLGDMESLWHRSPANPCNEVSSSVFAEKRLLYFAIFSAVIVIRLSQAGARLRATCKSPIKLNVKPSQQLPTLRLNSSIFPSAIIRLCSLPVTLTVPSGRCIRYLTGAAASYLVLHCAFRGLGPLALGPLTIACYARSPQSSRLEMRAEATLQATFL